MLHCQLLPGKLRAPCLTSSPTVMQDVGATLANRLQVSFDGVANSWCGAASMACLLAMFSSGGGEGALTSSWSMGSECGGGGGGCCCTLLMAPSARRCVLVSGCVAVGGGEGRRTRVCLSNLVNRRCAVGCARHWACCCARVSPLGTCCGPARTGVSVVAVWEDAAPRCNASCTVCRCAACHGN